MYLAGNTASAGKIATVGLRKFIAWPCLFAQVCCAQQCCAGEQFCATMLRASLLRVLPCFSNIVARKFIACTTPVCATLLRASLLRVLHCGMAMLRCGIGAARPRERTTEKKMKIEIDALGENDEEIERLGERRR
jgi:hypothetical protein